MAFIVTAVNVPSVTIADLGNRTLTPADVPIDLELEFTSEELYNSDDLFNEISLPNKSKMANELKA